MASIRYKIKKNLEVLGPFYMRALVASILLMVFGLILFGTGLYILGYKIAFLPNIPFIGYEVKQYIVYYRSDYISDVVPLVSSEAYFTSIEVKSRSVLILRVLEIPSSLAGHDLYMDIVREGSGELVKSVKIPTNPAGEHIVKVEIDPGRYDIYFHTNAVKAAYISVSLEVLASTESSQLIIAKWFQGVGLILSGLGLLTFIISYEIARREAEVAYMVAPKEFREMIARESYLRLLTSNVVRKSMEVEEVEEDTEYTD